MHEQSKLNPQIVAQMIQKISVTKLREDKSILFVIKNKNYQTMLRSLSNM